MKKVLKSRIFIFIATAILFTGIGVYGATIYPYQAREISYNEITVEDALNELYKKNSSGTISGRLNAGRTRGGGGYATIKFENIEAGKTLKLSNYTKNGAFTAKLKITLPGQTEINASNGEYLITETGTVSIYLFFYYSDEGNDHNGYVDYLIY